MIITQHLDPHRQYLTIIFRPPQDATTAQGKVNIIPSTTAVTTRFNLGIESGDELSSFYIQNMTFDVFEAPWSDVFKVWGVLLYIHTQPMLHKHTPGPPDYERPSPQ